MYDRSDHILGTPSSQRTELTGAISKADTLLILEDIRLEFLRVALWTIPQMRQSNNQFLLAS